MKVLALETSTPCGSAAILDGKRMRAEVAIDGGRRSSELLVRAIGSLLQDLHLSFADLEGYAVSVGPGSFTGLRTALAFLKGLIIAHPRPLAGVSSLEALAFQARHFTGRIVPVIDAHRGEVFAARFRADGSGRVERDLDDCAVSPESLAKLAEGPTLLLGPGLWRYGESIRSRLPAGALMADETSWSPRAVWVGALAAARLESGKTGPPALVAPAYVRRSDAELKLGPRRG